MLKFVEEKRRKEMQEEIPPEGYTEYEMTVEEYEEISTLTKGNNLGEIPDSKLITFWKRLGKKYKFDWETGKASPKRGKYFLAVPESN
ncbi:MAG: hypothetical protein KTR26_02180 [Flammeovirgaceae bacterium]|nr:hypothetical protein [Flammeovirgaceae bacterium]